MAKQRDVDVVRGLIGQARDGFRSFDGANWGHFDAARNYLRKAGYSEADAQRVLAQAQGLDGLTPGATVGNPTSAAALITLKVRRLTDTIKEALPFALFGAAEAPSGYRRALQGMLPAGVTLTSVEIGESTGKPGSAEFEFTSGGNTDIVEVTCTTAPYPNVLQSTLTDQFYLDRIRMSVWPVANTAQFAEDVEVRVANMWGRSSSNVFNPEQFRSPEQMQSGIIDINVGVGIDKETMILSRILPVATLEATYNLTVRRYDAVRI